MTFIGYQVESGYPKGRFNTPEPLGSVEREYEVRVLLYSDDDQDEVAGAYLYISANIAAPNSTYAFGNGFDDGAYLYFVDPQRVEKSDPSAPLFRATLKWKTFSSEEQKEDQEGEDGEKTDNPLDWHAELNTTSIVVEEVVEDAKYLSGYKGVAHDTLIDREDEDLSPVVNSAFQPFDPPATRPRSLTVYEISKIVETDNEDYEQYVDSVNEDEKPFNIRNRVYRIPPFAGKCEHVHYEPTTINERFYYRRKVRIVVDKEKTWRREYLDRGKAARAMPGDPDGHGSTFSNADYADGGLKFRPITSPGTDDPINEPVPLDGDGQPNDPDAKPVYGKWRTIRETSWAFFTFDN